MLKKKKRETCSLCWSCVQLLWWGDGHCRSGEGLWPAEILRSGEARDRKSCVEAVCENHLSLAHFIQPQSHSLDSRDK